MNTKPQNKSSILSLFVSLIAFIVVIISGVLFTLIQTGTYTVASVDPYRLTLLISGAVTILGVAVYAILEPESVRNFFSGRQARYSGNVFILTLAFLGIVIVVNYVVGTNSKIKEATSWDLTENKANTLSPELAAAMKDLPTDLSATGFFSQVPTDTARGLFERMQTASDGKFTFKFVNPDKDPVAAKEAGVTGDGKILLQMNGRSEVAASADESAILTAMNRLINPEARTVYFLIGHGEHDINSSDQSGFSAAKDTLEKKNITVKTLNLVADNRIPTDAKAIIIAGPMKQLTPNEVSLLNNYALHGGSLVVLEDPIPVTDFGDSPDPLADMLDSVWGLRLRNDFVVDTASQSSITTAIGAVPDPQHPVTASMNLVTVMPLSRSIEIIPRDGFTQTALLQTSVSSTSQSWGETDFTPLKGSTASVAFDPAVDTAGPVVLAAASENQEGGKVIVIGSSTDATDQAFSAYGNGDLFVNAVGWAAGQGKTYDVTPKDSTARTYNAPSQLVGLALYISVLCLIPLLIIGSGVYAWFARRRRG